MKLDIQIKYYGDAHSDAGTSELLDRASEMSELRWSSRLDGKLTISQIVCYFRSLLRRSQDVHRAIN
jgi:hypothetical protein